LLALAVLALATTTLSAASSLDLAVTDQIDNTVVVLLGTGSGSFGAPAGFGAGPSVLYPTTGDFNEDGHLDLAVANGDNHEVSVLLGDGTGNFGAPTGFPTTGATAYSVTVGDFNEDGHLDLAVANNSYPASTNAVSILLGDGTGNFGPSTNLTVGNNPSKVVIGDFNEDGHIDLAVANYTDDTVSIL
jgi:hypothetical protein